MENQEIEYIDPEVDDYIKYSYRDPESHADDPIYYAYVKSIVDSEGFDVKDEQLDDEYMEILKSTADCYLVSSKSLVETAKIAVKEFNRLEGTDLVFRRLVRNCGTLYVCYMTLECTNRCFYEAKIHTEMSQYLASDDYPNKLDIFRPAKHYNPRLASGVWPFCSNEIAMLSLVCEKDNSEFYKYEMISPAA